MSSNFISAAPTVCHQNLWYSANYSDNFVIVIIHIMHLEFSFRSQVQESQEEHKNIYSVRARAGFSSFALCFLRNTSQRNLLEFSPSLILNHSLLNSFLHSLTRSLTLTQSFYLTNDSLAHSHNPSISPMTHSLTHTHTILLSHQWLTRSQMIRCLLFTDKRSPLPHHLCHLQAVC